VTERLEEARLAPAPVLDLEVLGASAAPNVATPILRFTLRADEPTGRDVYMVALSALIHIDPGLRGHDDGTRALLVDLFGEPGRWGATTTSIVMAQVDTLVPSFTGTTEFTVPVPCTYDLEVAASKYFYSLPDGEVPLSFLFNGMVLYSGEADRLQVAQVPWSCTARWRMPVAAWRRVMDAYYPGGGWVRLQTETLDALAQRKAQRGVHSFDDTVRALLS